jgi:WD40 repeat protein
VAFSPDGMLLVSGTWDSTIKLWDVASGRELHTLSGHTANVDSVAFSSDGKLLAASGSKDNGVELWDVATGRELRTLSGHTNGIAFRRLLARRQGAGLGKFGPDGQTVGRLPADASCVP